MKKGKREERGKVRREPWEAREERGERMEEGKEREERRVRREKGTCTKKKKVKGFAPFIFQAIRRRPYKCTCCGVQPLPEGKGKGNREEEG
jgi:hypothetical protein